ncbi:MAG: galactose-1-epimerase, partial [Clostridia bacterium]|nr:galactose-1-epimerase [Clostridia bacterium]
PKVDRMKVRVFADRFTAIDDFSIPTGVRPVEGTPLDLRDWTKLGDRMSADDEQIKHGSGIDHNFILSSDRDLTGLRPAAEVFDPRTGRAMRVYTDMPSVQLYTGNFLSRRDSEKGVSYGRRRALCLETQCAPDSIHHPGEKGYDIALVDAEHPFKSATVYAFSVKNERV